MTACAGMALCGLSCTRVLQRPMPAPRMRYACMHSSCRPGAWGVCCWRQPRRPAATRARAPVRSSSTRWPPWPAPRSSRSSSRRSSHSSRIPAPRRPRRPSRRRRPHLAAAACGWTATRPAGRTSWRCTQRRCRRCAHGWRATWRTAAAAAHGCCSSQVGRHPGACVCVGAPPHACVGAWPACLCMWLCACCAH